MPHFDMTCDPMCRPYARQHVQHEATGINNANTDHINREYVQFTCGLLLLQYESTRSPNVHYPPHFGQLSYANC